MGKRGGTGKGRNTSFGSSNTVSLREETTGKKQQKKGDSSSNAKHLLKVEHLEKLAVWACGETSMTSLAAFFGQRLASVAESLGVSPNPSLFSCRRFVWFPALCYKLRVVRDSITLHLNFKKYLVH